MARISDYGIIGDCHPVALVGRDASIDWWCPKRFDAPSVFARVLDPDAGHCSIRLADQRSTTRAYVQDTNVLTTVLSGDDGDLEVTDCMPVGAFDQDNPGAVDASHCILRRMRCLSGEVVVTVDVSFMPDYARSTGRSYSRTFTLSAGESRWLRITSALEVSDDVDAREAANELVTTIGFWRP